MSQPEEVTDLASAIKSERKVRVWSVARLARELGVPERTVERWEAGKPPSFPMYIRMARLFGWPLGFLKNRRSEGQGDTSTVPRVAA